MKAAQYYSKGLGIDTARAKAGATQGIFNERRHYVEANRSQQAIMCEILLRHPWLYPYWPLLWGDSSSNLLVR